MLVGLLSGLTVSTASQIAQSGQYQLDQSVIASGGGQNAAGGNFTLDGTIGQAIAGTRSSGSTFSAAGGFWTALLAPTAAGVTIGGRVMTSDGRGIRNVRVVLTGTGGENLTVLTGTFGYYRFANIAAGATCIISVSAKHYIFNSNVEVRSITEDTNDINFTAHSF